MFIAMAFEVFVSFFCVSASKSDVGGKPVDPRYSHFNRGAPAGIERLQENSVPVIWMLDQQPQAKTARVRLTQAVTDVVWSPRLESRSSMVPSSFGNFMNYRVVKLSKLKRSARG